MTEDSVTQNNSSLIDISTNTRCSGTLSSLSSKELLLTEYLDEQTGDCFPLPLKV